MLKKIFCSLMSVTFVFFISQCDAFSGDSHGTLLKSKIYRDSNLFNNLKKMSEAKVGDLVTFGAYEQDNNLGNGPEDIDWIVVKADKKNLLLLSLYGLDTKQFGSDLSHSNTWDKSNLRKWLNKSFLKNAFTDKERKCIPDVICPPDSFNGKIKNYPGQKTQDRIFILSASEVVELLSDYKCLATPYAVANGAYYWEEGDNSALWWLRTPGKDAGHIAVVDYSSHIFIEGVFPNDAKITVRPAMWITLP